MGTLSKQQYYDSYHIPSWMPELYDNVQVTCIKSSFSPSTNQSESSDEEKVAQSTELVVNDETTSCHHQITIAEGVSSLAQDELQYWY